MCRVRVTLSAQNNKHALDFVFCRYSTYAWSSSILLTVATFILDHLDTIPTLYKPKFGQRRCWLNGKPAFLIYFNLPVGITLLANLIFFIHTAVVLQRLRRETEMVRSQNTESRYQFVCPSSSKAQTVDSNYNTIYFHAG